MPYSATLVLTDEQTAALDRLRSETDGVPTRRGMLERLVVTGLACTISLASSIAQATPTVARSLGEASGPRELERVPDQDYGGLPQTVGREREPPFFRKGQKS